MNKRVVNSLTEAEWLLVQETEREAMAELDEDALLELHTRVRRARSKYVKLYRRGASARVPDLGGRGFANPKNQRNRDKAEIFEKALARVSKQVALAAKAAAKELKQERLDAAARVRSGTGPSAEPRRAAGGASTPTDQGSAVKTTGGIKRDASTRSQGARRQAKRDSR